MADALPAELSQLIGATDTAAREAAWQSFLDTHSRLLLHVTRQVGGDYDTGMDAFAYILEQLRADDYRRLRGYSADGRCKFTTWLVVVARRLCLDHLRHRYGRARETDRDARERRAERRRVEDLLSERIDLSHLPDTATPGADALLIAAEQSRALAAMLERLDARDRLLLKLRFEDDLPAREIAALLHYPTQFHVYRRLNALVEGLRAAFAPLERQERRVSPLNKASEQ